MMSRNELILKPNFFFKKFPNDKFETKPETPETPETLEKEEEKIICKFCGHHITLSQNKIEVNGQHQHVFMNPVSVVYEIVCFSSANGCVNEGSPTVNDSWFSSYAWRFALCSGCLSHLGWFYQSDHDSFYGLISNHLSNISVRF